MSTTLERADALAAALVAAGVAAVVDVRDATANRPCVLIPPPRVDRVAALITWRLIVLAAHALGSRPAWEQLDVLLDDLADALPVELAEPISYTLPTGGDPIPAYAVTYTESV